MVEEVRARELAGVKVFGEPSRWTDVRQFLRTWREEGTRNSLKALEGGEMLLSKRKNELGNEGRLESRFVCMCVCVLCPRILLKLLPAEYTNVVHCVILITFLQPPCHW